MDAIVVGGGLVGGTLALALAREGLDVALVEPEGAGAPGRAYALSVASRRLLAALGLWEGLPAQPILEVRVADGRPGEAPSPLALRFHHAEIEEGPLGHMIEDGPLRAALDRGLVASGVERVAGRVVAQAPGEVTLEGGARLRAAVVAGCDGRESGTAARAGIARDVKAYGQTAVTGAVHHALSHGGVAAQLFLPGGPLAVLPLTGDRSSIVWSVADARAATLAASDESFLAALAPVMGDHLGAIGPVGPRGAYKLALSVARVAIADRLALAGDAARAVHPLAGQGLNAGLKDVAALAEVLGCARARGEDPGAADVLARYARWRGFDGRLLAAATDGIDRLFSNDSAVLRPLRDAGLAAVGAMGPLRRALLREAAGLTGDLPRLMR